MMSLDHAALLAEGWQAQTTIDEPRLSELAENYRALAYEVFLLYALPAKTECSACFSGSRLGTLYIRPTKQTLSDDEGLFD